MLLIYHGKAMRLLCELPVSGNLPCRQACMHAAKEGADNDCNLLNSHGLYE